MAIRRPPSLPLLVLVLLLASIAAADASAPDSYLKLLTETRDGGDELYCDSWRLSVETNNAGSWKTIPARCFDYVADYVTGPRSVSDSEVIASDSLAFAKSIAADAGGRLGGDGGKDAWVFDVDETLISNLPFYAESGYGSQIFNETAFDEWVEVARAPALPASLGLYNELRRLGFRVVLLTGRSEFQRNATEKNLLLAGYRSWDRLILRGDSEFGTTAVAYKSKHRAFLEAEGYKILGSSGDQWSDLTGWSTAIRSFKLPNPMYYIA